MAGFYIDMTAVSTVVAEMQGATAKIQATTDQLEADAQTRLVDWEGAARQQYLVCKTQWDSAVADMSAVLSKAGVSLDTINQNHANAEASNVGLW